jgi:hypothetical protein
MVEEIVIQNHYYDYGHRREIEEESTPLGRHFSRCGYTNLAIQMIDCVKQGQDEAIFVVEVIWQNRLATFTQHGNINVRDEGNGNTRSTALTFFDL